MKSILQYMTYLTYCSCDTDRSARSIEQPCDTTSPPRPVSRQLICFLNSETQDFAVSS